MMTKQKKTKRNDRIAQSVAAICSEVFLSQSMNNTLLFFVCIALPRTVVELSKLQPKIQIEVGLSVVLNQKMTEEDIVLVGQQGALCSLIMIS